MCTERADSVHNKCGGELDVLFGFCMLRLHGWFGWLNLFNAVFFSFSEEVLAGIEIPGGGGRGKLYLTLQCYRHDSCIQMGSDESYFNATVVPLIVRDKDTTQCRQTRTFEERTKAESTSFCLPA